MAITTTEARRNLARLIERVNRDRTEIEIVSKRGSAVLMAKDEFDALMETSYLLSSPRTPVASCPLCNLPLMTAAPASTTPRRP